MSPIKTTFLLDLTSLKKNSELFLCQYTFVSCLHIIPLLGYFIQDFFDVALNESLKRSWEVLLHHSAVMNFTLCFCVSLCVFTRLCTVTMTDSLTQCK